MYSLQKYESGRTKFTCPQCGKPKTFTRYVDESNNYLADHVGRCDREENCGYHFPPRQFFEDNPELKPQMNNKSFNNEKPTKMTSYENFESVKESKLKVDKTHLFKYLSDIFGKEKTLQAFDKYHIGYSDYWPGSNIFWQIDQLGRVRAGKVLQYNAFGKRVKEPFPHINWVHTIKACKDYNLSQCLFGEHLLENASNIGVCEGEKTALVMSICKPEITWVATGGIANLKLLNAVKSHKHKFILFPDNGAYTKWFSKSKAISHSNISISEICENEKLTEDLGSGFDLADWVINFNTNK